LIFLFILFFSYDNDGDGFPDIIEFHKEKEKEVFRQWFKNVAFSIYHFKYYKIKDCGDFVRIVLRETLKPHDKKWRKRFKKLFFSETPDIPKFCYPNIPYLGTRIFRVRKGIFSSQNIEKDFSSFADTKILLKYNTVFVSKKIEDALDGDLLFFFVNGSYHVMMHFIVSGKRYLLYNTGGSNPENRLIPYEALFKIPAPCWHPVPENLYFLGIYRLKILD